MGELRKELGKIASVSFGHCGYQECMLGIQVTLEGKGWGVGDSKGGWDAEIIKHDKHCQWTEADREKDYVAVMRYVSKLLKEAKVHEVSKLKGIPVEVTFDGNCLKEWRILEEVL